METLVVKTGNAAVNHGSQSVLSSSQPLKFHEILDEVSLHNHAGYIFGDGPEIRLGGRVKAREIPGQSLPSAFLWFIEKVGSFFLCNVNLRKGPEKGHSLSHAVFRTCNFYSLLLKAKTFLWQQMRF